mmetsp:Transcript_73143/g.205404  ORF Transcript_73143/g.205404 Transcript_73143/m.205404 type:complete len:331 (-) Transcript_73143:548-1540(-)
MRKSAALNLTSNLPKHSQNVCRCAVLRRRHFLQCISCDCQACATFSSMSTSRACTASLSYRRSQLWHTHRPGPRDGWEVTSTCEATQHHGQATSRKMSGKQGLSKVLDALPKLLMRSFWHMRSRSLCTSSVSVSSRVNIVMRARMNSNSTESGAARRPGTSGKLHFCSKCLRSRSAFRSWATGSSGSTHSPSSSLSLPPSSSSRVSRVVSARPFGISRCCCTWMSSRYLRMRLRMSPKKVSLMKTLNCSRASEPALATSPPAMTAPPSPSAFSAAAPACGSSSSSSSPSSPDPRASQSTSMAWPASAASPAAAAYSRPSSFCGANSSSEA